MKTVSLEDFDKPLRCDWNTRRAQLVDVFPAGSHLDLIKLYENIGEDVRKSFDISFAIIIFILKVGYKHSDVDFKELLRKVDGLRYAPSLAKKEQFYRYRCQKCGQEYHRKRRVNTKKYVCGRCHGKLSYVDIK